MNNTSVTPNVEEPVCSERLYQQFFESSSEAFYVMPLAEDGTPKAFVDVNQRACDMLGFSRQELLSITPLDIDAEPSEAVWRAAHQRLRKKGHDRYQRQHLCRDGTAVPVEISARIFHQGGQDYVLAVARDISQSLETQTRLRAAQRDLLALVDASLELSALVKPDTTILRINESGARRFGTTPEQLIGCRLTDLSPSDIAPKRVEVAREVVRQRKTISFRDFRSGMWLEHTISPVVDDAGVVSRFAVFSRDITVSYLRRELDSLFNEIDRDVLKGITARALVDHACRRFQEVFVSPLVWYTASGGTRSDTLSVRHGAWAREADGTAVGNWEPAGVRSAPRITRLRVIKTADRPAEPLLSGMPQQPASLALLELTLPDGQFGVLGVASLYSDTFDQEPIAALLRHTAARLQVAFEMAADHRELALVKQALKTAHSAVIITDHEGRIVWTNNAFTRYTGYRPGEIQWVQALEISALQDRDGRTSGIDPQGSEDPVSEDPFRAVMSAGKVWSGEALSRRRDGSSYAVLQTITPVFSASRGISHLIAIQEDISGRKRDEAQIRYLADHDDLTGLHNRAFLLEHLYRVLAHDRRQPQRNLAFLYLDIDQFKGINDTHGHACGDAVLVGFAGRLREVVRQGDLVCRIGGDEFVLVLMDIRGGVEAEGIARKLLDNLARPLVCNGQSFVVGSSIGIALAPADGDSPELLLKRADAAMYEAKRQGRGRACFWHSLGVVE